MRATATDAAWKTPVLCWPLGNKFIFWARAKEEYWAAGEEDPAQRAGTKRTFPTAFGTGFAAA